jgi:hypothetical protein
MPVNTKTEVVGIKEAIRDLGKLDKDLARELRKEARNVMQPIVQDAKQAIPNTALSGMSRPWTSKTSGVQLLPWSGTAARKYVKAKTSTKKTARVWRCHSGFSSVLCVVGWRRERYF